MKKENSVCYLLLTKLKRVDTALFIHVKLQQTAIKTEIQITDFKHINQS